MTLHITFCNYQTSFPENYNGCPLIIYNESEEINSSIESNPFKIVKGEGEFYFEDGKNNLRQLDVLNPLSNLKNNQIVARVNGFNRTAQHILYDVIIFHKDNNILFLN